MTENPKITLSEALRTNEKLERCISANGEENRDATLTMVLMTAISTATDIPLPLKQQAMQDLCNLLRVQSGMSAINAILTNLEKSPDMPMEASVAIVGLEYLSTIDHMREKCKAITSQLAAITREASGLTPEEAAHISAAIQASDRLRTADTRNETIQ